MASFELADGPRQVNGGCSRVLTQQLYPQTSAISGTRPGVSGASTGLTTFQWSDDVNWWVPSLSYFNVRGHFLNFDGSTGLLYTGSLGYCDNWVPTWFSQIQYLLNSQTVELLQNPPQSDTALVYSACDLTWLRSYGTSSGLGEALQTRIWNSACDGIGTGAATANANEVVACWRPSLSIFDVAHGIPPGGQHRIDLSWSNIAEQLMIQSFGTKLAGTDYRFIVDEFTFYKTSITPDVSIPRPMGGYIELHPVQCNQYPINGNSTLQVNVPLPATCERMLIVLQDNNAASNFAAGQNGLKPITSFVPAVSTGSGDFLAFIQNFYVSFPELQYQYPNPTYSFTGGITASTRAEYQRAYQDWITTCRGASGGYEGSIPFGTYDSSIGAFIVAPNATGGAVYNPGNIDNYNQGVINTGATALVSGGTGQTVHNQNDLAITVGTAAQTSRFGWVGDKFILAVPVIRPPDRLVTNANLYMQFSNAPVSATLTIIMSYSMGLACESDPNGRYQFEILRGL